MTHFLHKPRCSPSLWNRATAFIGEPLAKLLVAMMVIYGSNFGK